MWLVMISLTKIVWSKYIPMRAIPIHDRSKHLYERKRKNAVIAHGRELCLIEYAGCADIPPEHQDLVTYVFDETVWK